MERKEALQIVLDMAEKYREQCGPELPEPLEKQEAIGIVEEIKNFIEHVN